MVQNHIRGPTRTGVLDDPVAQSLRNETEWEAAADEWFGDDDEEGEE